MGATVWQSLDSSSRTLRETILIGGKRVRGENVNNSGNTQWQNAERGCFSVTLGEGKVVVRVMDRSGIKQQNFSEGAEDA